MVISIDKNDFTEDDWELLCEEYDSGYENNEIEIYKIGDN